MKEFVRRLRKEQTDAERKLWLALRGRRLEHFKFRRQHSLGPYIADFCCPEKRIIIEVDGGQHTQQILKDQKRTKFLNQKGYQVLRLWDHEVLQSLDSVLEKIYLTLTDPHPDPLPRRERGETTCSQ